MEDFTEEHSKQFLNSEWLVKIDSIKATPYLFKYVLSVADLSCCVLLTDTKSVWVEVLNGKTLARRWRVLNPLSPPPYEKSTDEDAWREQTLDLLSNAHTMGGILDLSFEVVDSNYSDMAFELECQAFKWKWETCFIGHQRSSEIISKHLIFPLISFSHLTSSSAEPVTDLTDTDLEKSVDKLARTARRTVDNHIKNSLSKPRVATSIRRMTAMFNFVPNLKPVVSVAEIPLLEVPKLDRPSASAIPFKRPDRQEENHTHPEPLQKEVSRSIPVKSSQKRERSTEPEVSLPVADSETETESEDESPKTKNNTNPIVPAVTPSSSEPSRPGNGSGDQTWLPARTQQSQSLSDPPPRPIKKAKPSTDGSDSENEKKTSRGNSIAPRPTATRGTRQPIKRGGKRF